MTEDLVRMSEVAVLLGVSHQRATTLSTRPDFPAPFAVGTGVKLWCRSAIEAYAEARAEKVARYDPTPKRRATT